MADSDPRGDERWRPRNLAELVQAQAERHPELEVLTFVDVAADGCLLDQRRTFPQLHDNARRLATFLQRTGVAPGDRFGLMLHNQPEFVEAMIAAAWIGAVFVPIDPRSLGDKLTYMLNAVAAKVVIAGNDALPALLDAAEALPHVRTLLAVDAVPVGGTERRLPIESYADAIASGPAGLETAEPDPGAMMFMMFTSGTTGHPKAVVRTHGAHMAGLKGLRALGVEIGDTLYTGLPLNHINAQSTLGAALALPTPAVFSRRFTKRRLWDICRAYGCTVFTLLGGMIPEIYAAPESPDDADNPVRLVIASGMPADLWDAYRTRFGVEITEVYGSTEAGGVLINRMGEGPSGSMGKPPKGTIAAILDEAGDPCPPGVSGELCFRPEAGGVRPVTYFRNAAASDAKTRDGWYRSGDIAHMDADGWFYFHHRAGGGVRRNGDFINTAVVETVLAKCPGVLDVFVYGATTPQTVAGEKALVAAVVLQPGADVGGLQAWCAGRLQKNEIPEIWQVLPQIPKTVSEKPIERDCLALLEADLVSKQQEPA